MIRRRLKPRPKALWLSAFPPTAYGLAQEAAEKAGKPLPPLPAKVRRNARLRPVSARRRPLLAEYAKLRRAFLKQHPLCMACDAIHLDQTHRTKPARDIHHMNGRVGRLLTATDFWLPVCRGCHDWIGAHPKEARSLGLLCQPGEWNRQPDTLHEVAAQETRLLGGQP